MNWLAERELVAKFVCRNCGRAAEMSFKAATPVPTVEDLNMNILCEVSYGDEPPRSCIFEYTETLPYNLGGVTYVEYEHNGRKGIRVSDGKGGVQHRAKSKDIYLRTGKIPEGMPQSVDSRAERAFFERMTQK